jgi:hypothetical protein
VNAVFDVYCPGHGARVLLGPRRIERVQTVTNSIHLHWRCYCGTRGVLLLVDAPNVDVGVAA